MIKYTNVRHGSKLLTQSDYLLSCRYQATPSSHIQHSELVISLSLRFKIIWFEPTPYCDVGRDNENAVRPNVLWSLKYFPSLGDEKTPNSVNHPTSDTEAVPPSLISSIIVKFI